MSTTEEPPSSSSYSPWRDGPLTERLVDMFISGDFYRSQRCTALMLAAYGGDLPLVKRILARSDEEDVLSRDILGWDAIRWARCAGSHTVKRWLKKKKRLQLKAPLKVVVKGPDGPRRSGRTRKSSVKSVRCPCCPQGVGK